MVIELSWSSVLVFAAGFVLAAAADVLGCRRHRRAADRACRKRVRRVRRYFYKNVCYSCQERIRDGDFGPPEARAGA